MEEIHIKLPESCMITSEDLLKKFAETIAKHMTKEEIKNIIEA
jgi:hypothetical protein